MLTNMTDTKSPKVLKKEEVVKGNHGTVVELSYVPIVNEEAEATAQDVTVKLPNDTKVTITKIAHSANKELFLVRSIVVKQHVGRTWDCMPKLRSMRRRWKSARSTLTGTIKTQRLNSKTRGLSRSMTMRWRSMPSWRSCEMRWSRRCLM